MKASGYDGLTIQHRLQNFLLTYRSIPHSTTNQAPCELFLGRKVCTRLDLLTVQCGGLCVSSSSSAEGSACYACKATRISIGVKGDGERQTPRFGKLDTWKNHPEEWTIDYVVDVQGGRVWKCHVDHLKECLKTDTEGTGLVNDDVSDSNVETYDVEPPQEDPAVTVSENVPVSENTPVELRETITKATNDTGCTTAVDSATESAPGSVSASHKYPLRDRTKHRRFN